MGTLRIEALRSLAGIARHKQAIDALNLASRRPCPFATYEYLQTFLEHDEYGAKESELLFLAAFEGAQLVGYLPLRQTREQIRHVPYWRIGMFVSHDTDRPHVVARAEDEPRVADAMYRHLLAHESWSMLELGMQDAASALRSVPPLSPLRFKVRTFENMPNSTIPMSWKDLTAYFKSIDKQQRQHVARYARRIFNAGKVERVTSADPLARLPLLELYLDLERRSWKEGARAGIRRHARRIAHFRALCAADQPAALRVDLVLLDGVPVAGLVNLEYDRKVYGLETSFDEAYADLGPGVLLNALSIGGVIERGLESLNLNGNYAYYKAKMGGVVTPTVAVQIFKVGTPPWLKAMAGELKRRLLPPQPEGERFNADKRRTQGDGQEESAASTRPSRDAERALAQRTLAALEAQGAKLERLGGEALQRTLPFNTKKDAA